MIFSDDQQDLLTELINIGVGRAALSLNSLIESHVTLSVPTIQLQDYRDMAYSEEPVTAVQMEFFGPFRGVSSLIFPPESAVELTKVLLGEPAEDEELDTLKMGALCEIGNILLNAVVGSIGNVLLEELEYSVPDYGEGPLRDILEQGGANNEGQLILARMEFQVQEHRIQGSVLLYFEFGSVQAFRSSLDGALSAA